MVCQTRDILVRLCVGCTITRILTSVSLRWLGGHPNTKNSSSHSGEISRRMAQASEISGRTAKSRAGCRWNWPAPVMVEDWGVSSSKDVAFLRQGIECEGPGKVLCGEFEKRLRKLRESGGISPSNGSMTASPVDCASRFRLGISQALFLRACVWDGNRRKFGDHFYG